MKKIPGYSNYRITKDGRVWSLFKNKWMRPTTRDDGYLMLSLISDSIKRKPHLVHRLVLQTYIGECPKKQECRHLNGIRTDNRLENLCWGTRSENQNDATKHGTRNTVAKKGKQPPAAKLTEEIIRFIIYAVRTKEITQRKLAKIFKVRTVTINDIVKKRTWKHIWRNYDE